MMQPQNNQTQAMPTQYTFEKNKSQIELIKEQIEICDGTLGILRESLRDTKMDVVDNLKDFTNAFDMLDITASTFLFNKCAPGNPTKYKIGKNKENKDIEWTVFEIIQHSEEWIDRKNIGKLNEENMTSQLANMGALLYRAYKLALVNNGLYAEALKR
jgi:hypothetical protein